MLSWLIRIGAAGFNFAGDALERLGWPLAQLDPDELRRRSQRRTGLSDFGAWEYPDALEVACGSLSSDADLSLSGTLAVREHLCLALETRLQRVALERQHPEIFAAPLNRPLIVLGLPRSGTTYLHRLLVDLPGNRGLKTWEIRRPFPPNRGGDHRRREAWLALSLLRRLAPELDAKHVLEVDAAEECVGLFDSSLWTPTLWRLAAARSYLAWYLTQDPEPGYRVYRRLLQVFQARSPEARLVLKLPNHMGFVGTLLRVIPEALVVQTHRDPVPVIASYNSLMNSVHGVSAHRVNRQRSGRQALQMWGELTDRCLAQRQSLSAGQVFDIDYRSLLESPEETVRGIHRHFELPFTEWEAQAVRALVEERPQGRHGDHIYALEDCQLARPEVEARFRSYVARHLAG